MSLTVLHRAGCVLVMLKPEHHQNLCLAGGTGKGVLAGPGHCRTKLESLCPEKIAHPLWAGLPLRRGSSVRWMLRPLVVLQGMATALLPDCQKPRTQRWPVPPRRNDTEAVFRDRDIFPLLHISDLTLSFRHNAAPAPPDSPPRLCSEGLMPPG